MFAYSRTFFQMLFARVMEMVDIPALEVGGHHDRRGSNPLVGTFNPTASIFPCQFIRYLSDI